MNFNNFIPTRDNHPIIIADFINFIVMEFVKFHSNWQIADHFGVMSLAQPRSACIKMWAG
jgi:hypothetical protein